MIGQSVGPYQVLSKLGEGGMGEVYRARDTRLGRDVAIKILPDAFASDPERLARFEREARTLASLNHPHIAQIHGLEGGTAVSPDGATTAPSVLVMELVEGEDLSQRIARGPMPIDEALPMAVQIAEALEAAHEQGIIHRDLKPANIKVRGDGTVKVLDFGLAKAMDGAGGAGGDNILNSPTITSPAMTARGVILGTAAYMAPEQARGKPVDKRADIWAFGVVLYEMLTGAQLFSGETVTDTIAEVMKREIDLAALPADTPANVRHVLSVCLQRDPKLRLRDIGDARLELTTPMAPALVAPPPTAAPGARPGLAYPLVAAVTVMAMIAGGAAVWMFRRPAPPAPRQVVRTSLPFVPGGVRLSILRPQIAITPNGRTVAMVRERVFIRHLDTAQVLSLQGTEGATGVFTSPDSEWIGYTTSTALMKVRVSGGAPVLIHGLKTPMTPGASAVSWADDGHVYFSDQGGMYAVPAGGGAAREVLRGDAPAQIHMLPGSRQFIAMHGRNTTQLSLHALDGSAPIALGEGASPRYLPSGVLLFANGTTVFAAPLDPAAKRIGSPVPVLDSVALLGASSQFDVASDGTLVYLPGNLSSSPRSSLQRVTRQGATSPITDVQLQYSDPRLSPDGRMLALHITSESDDVWVQDLARGALTRLTFDRGEDETPAWSPDGAWIAYAGNAPGVDTRAILRRRADGSGDPEVLWASPGHSHVTDWAADGLVIETSSPGTRNDVMLLPLTPKAAPQPLVATPFVETSGRVSPDGKWLAYQSDQSGRVEIYAQAYPAGGARVQISTSGGMQPVWSPKGDQIYFRSDAGFMSAAVTAGPRGLDVQRAVVLFKDTFGSPQGISHTTYDVFPDGSFLTVSGGSSAAETASILMVINWFEELAAKLKK